MITDKNKKKAQFMKIVGELSKPNNDVHDENILKIKKFAKKIKDDGMRADVWRRLKPIMGVHEGNVN